MSKNEPIIYAGTDKAAAVNSAPREVLAQCKELKCDNCGTLVLVVERTFADTIILSERTGRRLVVLCQTCTEQEGDDEKEMAFMYLPDREIDRDLTKFKAEQN